MVPATWQGEVCSMKDIKLKVRDAVFSSQDIRSKKLAKYVANMKAMFILFFCFMASRGIFGQGLGCMTAVDQLSLFLFHSYFRTFLNWQNISQRLYGIFCPPEIIATAMDAFDETHINLPMFLPLPCRFLSGWRTFWLGLYFWNTEVIGEQRIFKV